MNWLIGSFKSYKLLIVNLQRTLLITQRSTQYWRLADIWTLVPAHRSSLQLFIKMTSATTSPVYYCTGILLALLIADIIFPRSYSTAIATRSGLQFHQVPIFDEYF
jgi:hypothetical protein